MMLVLIGFTCCEIVLSSAVRISIIQSSFPGAISRIELTLGAMIRKHHTAKSIKR